jgi:chromosome segregation ATPase
LKRDLDDAQKEVRAAQTEKKQADQVLERHKRKARDITAQIQRQELEVEKLQDELEAATPQTGTLEALQTLLKEQQAADRLHAATFQDSVVAKDQINREQHVLKRQLSEMDAVLEEIEAKIAKANARVVKLEEKRHQAVLAKNDKIARIEDAKERLQEIQTECDEQAEIVTNYTTQAQAVSGRVAIDAGETADSLDKRLTAMRRTIERNESE